MLLRTETLARRSWVKTQAPHARPGRSLGVRGCAVLLACAGLALTPGAAALSATSAPSFAAARSYATGDGPESVAIGDLNGDGKPDLATANLIYRTNTVSVLLNRGDGSFQAKLDYRTGGDPYSVVIGDLNGDGKQDLATANLHANTVSVLLNRPGLCTVQDVFRQTLPAAKRTIARANCRVGTIRRVYSKSVKRGRVISQKPKPGTVLPNRGKVNLVVSRGRRPS